MAVTPPGQAPTLHTAVSANAQLMWNAMTATLSSKNNVSKAFHHNDLATAAGVPLSAVPALVKELQAAAPEHFINALKEDKTGRYQAYVLAPSNLLPGTNAF